MSSDPARPDAAARRPAPPVSSDLVPKRLLRPERPRHAEALSAVSDRPPHYFGPYPEMWTAGRHGLRWRGGAQTEPYAVTEPDAAWEVMEARGVIPAGWTRGDGRGFSMTEAELRARVRAAVARGAGALTDRVLGHGVVEGVMMAALARHPEARIGWCPPTIPACVAMAGDPPGVLAAEEHAREYARRLAPWGCPTPARVVWRVGAWQLRTVPAADYDCQHRLHPIDGPARARVLQALADRAPAGTAAWDGARAVVLAAAWDEAAADGRALRVEGPPGTLAPVASLGNPWAPLAALWSAGYALERVDEGALYLLCPMKEEG